MFKIVFFDLDGTLLTSKKDVLEENKVAIKNALDNGIEVCICSGRPQSAIRYYQQMSGAGRYIIADNGAEIYDTKEDEQLFKCPIEEPICLELFEHVLKNNLFVRIDTKYARYINRMDYKILDEVPMEEDYKKFFKENDILQISIGSNNAKDIDEIVAKLDESLKVENRFIAENLPGDVHVINIINKSASKGNAILGLCKFLKIKPEEAMAFGDDYNDISMMNSVYGVAMGNAYDEIKNLSREVLRTTNNEPGIAEVLNRIVEERKET